MKRIRTLLWKTILPFLRNQSASLFRSSRGTSLALGVGISLIGGLLFKSLLPYPHATVHIESASALFHPQPRPGTVPLVASAKSAEGTDLEFSAALPPGMAPDREWTRTFDILQIPARSGFLYSRPQAATSPTPSLPEQSAPVSLDTSLLRIGLMRFCGRSLLTLYAWPGARLFGPAGTPESAGAGPWTVRLTSKGVQVLDSQGKSLGLAGPGTSWRLQGEEASTLVGVGTPGSVFRRYHGALEIVADAGHLRVVNEVDLESYLQSVVVSEMGGNSPLEALKAQAVASRTFALCSLGRWVSQGYDLRDTTDSQVYNGADVVTPTANLAVSETSGLILTNHGQPILAQFCADCGGVTTPGDSSDSCPRSVSDAEAHENGTGQRFHVWKLVYTPAQMAELMKRSPQTQGIGTLENVEVAEKDSSGRVIHLHVVWNPNPKSYAHPKPPPPDRPSALSDNTTAQADRPEFHASANLKTSSPFPPSPESKAESPGVESGSVPSPLEMSLPSPVPAVPHVSPVVPATAYVAPEMPPVKPAPWIVRDITGNTLRTVLGLDTLRSTLFTIRRGPNKEFILEGKGWGHGHGMCQDGAIVLASPPHAHRFQTILLHYYAGAALEHVRYTDPEDEPVPSATPEIAVRNTPEVVHGR